MASAISTAPAFRYLLFFIPGIMLQHAADLPPCIPAALLCAGMIAVLICGEGKFSRYVCILCILASGMLRCAVAVQHYRQKLIIPPKEACAADITVLQQKTTPRHLRYYVVKTRLDRIPVRATLYAGSDLPVLLPGIHYHMDPVRIEAIDANVNPYAFDYREYARGRGISHRINAKPGTVVEAGPVKAPLRYLAFRVRNSISVRFLAVLGIEKGSMVNGFLLGMRSEIPDCVAERFRELGISHLLAVSGLHVGLLVLIVYQLLLVLSLHRVLRTVLICVFLVFYCCLCGASPSVIRASLMTGLLLTAPVFHRRYHAVNAVAATAVILLMVNPFYLRDVGFQFSFAAVFGILSGYSVLKQKLPFRPVNPALRYAYEMLLVSASAALFTAPVALFYFNTLQIASLFLNIVAIPLTFCVMITGMISIPCLYLPSFISDLVLHALDLGLTFFRFLLRTASRSGIWTWAVSSYWKPLVTAFVLLPAIGLAVPGKRYRRLLYIAVILTSAAWFYLNSRPELVQLALKRGQSVVFRSARKALIINTGATAFRRNDYDDAIRPMLEHWGVKEVTVIVTAREKGKTGTIRRIRRDFPDCPVFLPGKGAALQTEYQTISSDTAWTMGGKRIDVRTGEGELSVRIPLPGGGISIGHTDAVLHRAEHYVIFGRRMIRKE